MTIRGSSHSSQIAVKASRMAMVPLKIRSF
jgi:hypothetical protein